MKDVKVSDLQERFKAALNDEQDRFENSAIFNDKDCGEYCEGYVRGLWSAYQTYVQVGLDYLQQLIDDYSEEGEKHIKKLEELNGTETD